MFSIVTPLRISNQEVTIQFHQKSIPGVINGNKDAWVFSSRADDFVQLFPVGELSSLSHYEQNGRYKDRCEFQSTVALKMSELILAFKR